MVNNSNLPLVSIITPSYNQASYLEETILSIITQDYKNIEPIIIDGGSDDDSVEIIKKYEKHLSFWVSEKDNGQADAINKGIEKSTGEFICWINSDDVIYPNFISRRVAEFKLHPEVDFIYGDVHQGKDLKNLTYRKGKKTDYSKMLRTIDVPIPQQSAIWKRSVIDKVGILDDKWHVLLDREYFMRIAMNCDILYIPGSVAFFRNHKLSKSIAESLRWTEEMPEYYLKLFDSSLPVKYKHFWKECITNMYLYCAVVAKESASLKEDEFIEKAKTTSNFYYYKYSYYVPIMNKIKTFIDKIL
jgi:glycosyltransferase involved in cell wall biosynthesis